jgi:integrase
MYIRRSANGRYKCEIHLPNGRRVSRTFDRKRDAETWGRAQETSFNRGEFIDPARGRKLFEEWAWECHSSAQHLAESTRKRYEIAIRNSLVPTFCSYRLAAIDHEAVQTYVNTLIRDGLAPNSVRKTFNVLSGMMRRAVSAGRIAKSPCTEIQLPRIEPSEMRFLSAEELDLLASELDERYHVLILTAGYLGLRWSELVALRREDVILPAGRLRVTHSLVEVNGHFHEGPPKTAKGLRSMTVPRFLADAIGEHIGRFPSS